MFTAKMAWLSRLCLSGAGTFLFIGARRPMLSGIVCFPTSA
jgi:hypothetical protein